MPAQPLDTRGSLLYTNPHPSSCTKNKQLYQGTPAQHKQQQGASTLTEKTTPATSLSEAHECVHLALYHTQAMAVAALLRNPPEGAHTTTTQAKAVNQARSGRPNPTPLLFTLCACQFPPGGGESPTPKDAGHTKKRCWCRLSSLPTTLDTHFNPHSQQPPTNPQPTSPQQEQSA